MKFPVFGEIKKNNGRPLNGWSTSKFIFGALTMASIHYPKASGCCCPSEARSTKKPGGRLPNVLTEDLRDRRCRGTTQAGNLMDTVTFRLRTLPEGTTWGGPW